MKRTQFGKYLFYLVLLCFSLNSCDEVPVEIPEFVPIETGKVMLVEELTGVNCAFCPGGSARLDAISELYPGNIIIVGIHGKDLADPLPESKYDFRNQDAEDLESFLKPWLGKPSAYFNRIRYENLDGLFGNPKTGLWQNVIEDELNKAQVTNISLNKEYDPITRKLTLNVTTVPLIDIEGNEFKVTIMLTENKIHDAQNDQHVIFDDYIHNHVLRKVVTKFDGDFFAETLSKNVAVSKQYSYTLPESDQGIWVDDNIEVIAFIAMTEGQSEEVLQAVSEHLID